MGSFRLSAGRLHHHKHFNFAESLDETVWPSLPHSCSDVLITLQGHTFFRSYGVNLPSSFSRVLSSALEYSSRAPVSVCGTVNYKLKLSGFSWDLVQLLREQARSINSLGI